MNAKFLCAALTVLALLHHDAWLWNNESLVVGFLPAGLAYHAAYSLATAALWAVASRHAWPPDLEAADSARKPAGDRPK